MALSLEVSRAVVGESFGELTLTFTNDSGAAIGPCRVCVDAGDRGSRAGVVFLPSKPDGGYAIGALLPPRASVQRRFAVKVSCTEHGHKYAVTAEVSWPGGSERVVTEVAVAAGHEFDAVVEAAEQLRQTLLSAAPEQRDERERSVPAAAAPAALDPSTFQWALAPGEKAKPLYARAARGKPLITP